MTAPGEAPLQPLATPMRRLGGFAIDSIIYLAMVLVVLIWADVDLQAFAEGETPLPNSVLLVNLVLVGFYQVTLTAIRGQTIGKMIVRTRVIDQDTGAIPSWQQSFLRWGAPAAIGVVPWLGYLVLVMYAWLLWDRRRQGLHDKLAGTLVVSVI